MVKNGLVKISSKSNLLNKDTLSILRKELEKNFQVEDYPPELDLHQIKNEVIQDTIFKSLSNNNIKAFFIPMIYSYIKGLY